MRSARATSESGPAVLPVYAGLLAAVVTGVVWSVGLHRYLSGYCTGGSPFGSVDGHLTGLTSVQCTYERGAPVVEADLLPLTWTVVVLVAGVLVTTGVVLLSRRAAARRA